jgi:hypothetical protein
MNQCIILPEDIKNIIIEYILPPKRWIIKNKKEITKILKLPEFFDDVYSVPYDDKMCTTKAMFSNVLCFELCIIAENIRKRKKLEIDILSTGQSFHDLLYFHDFVYNHSYSVYIHGHMHDIIALKYM